MLVCAMCIYAKQQDIDLWNVRSAMTMKLVL